MSWSEQKITEFIQTLKPVKASPALIERVISLLDLTSLNETDTEESIAFFCAKAQTSYGNVASVVVYPKFVRLVAAQFANTSIKAGTVANFPQGNTDLESVLIEIGRALQDGVQEIDVVFPYAKYLAGDKAYARDFVESCKAACGDEVILKIILETGAFPDLGSIFDAAYDVLLSGADFIKTSTGKIEKGATLEAAAVMLVVIRELNTKLKRRIGMKVSGGISDLQQAAYYIELADEILGRNWVKPDTFRIGASKLMDELLKII